MKRMARVTLPKHYLITPAPENDAEFMHKLGNSLKLGIKLMQLRAKNMNVVEYKSLAQKVVALARQYHCKVLLNTDPQLVQELAADGVHLDSKRLAECSSRPLPTEFMVAASGHSLQELVKAKSIGANFALLSPVKYTSSHPDTEPLGWEKFKSIVAQVELPIYALGGVSADDEATALAAGAQGLAGIRGYWNPQHSV